MNEKKTKIKYAFQTVLIYLSIVSCFAGLLSFYFYYTITPLMLVGPIILIYRIVFKVRQKNHFYKFELLYALFLLVATIGIFFAYDKYQSIKNLVKLLAIIFSLLQFRALYHDARKESIAKAFSRVSFVFIILTLVLYVASLLNLNFDYNRADIKLPGVMVDRKMPRLMTLAAPDPNASCQFLMIPLLFSLCFLHRIKRTREKVLYILNIVLYTLAVLLTLSRGGMVAALCALFVYYLFNDQKIKTKIAITGLLLATGAIFIAASIPILNSNPTDASASVSTTPKQDGPVANAKPADDPSGSVAQNGNELAPVQQNDGSLATTMAKRFTEEDGGSGRIRLWRNALTTFRDHPLFGIGMNGSTTYNAKKYGGRVKITHNMYLDALAETGIFAAIIFAFFIIAIMVKTLVLKRFDSGFSLTIMVAFFASCMFLSKQYWEIFFIHMLIVDLCAAFLMPNIEKKRLKKIKASVILPTLNSDKKYLESSIKSILSQTHDNLELIIVVDGGDDDRFIANYFDDERIRIIKHKKTRGIAKSLNEAIRQSTGEYVVRMDADDVSIPWRIERQIKYMEQNPNIDVSSTFFKKWKEDGSVFACESFTSPEDTKARLLFTTSIAHPAVIFRRSSINSVEKLYDEEYERAEDYELWQRLSMSGKRISIAPFYGLKYRVHKSQVSTSKRKEQLSVVTRIYITALNRLELDETMHKYLSMLAGNERLSSKKGLRSFIKTVISANKRKKLYRQRSLKKVLWSTYCVCCLRNRTLFVPNIYFAVMLIKKIAYKGRMSFQGLFAGNIK